MLNYKVIAKNKKYVIHEKATDQIIMTFDKLCEARNRVKKLNFGAAFDGWTPSFMIKK